MRRGEGDVVEVGGVEDMAVGVDGESGVGDRGD